MQFNSQKRQLECLSDECFSLKLGKNSEFISIIQYIERLGFDTARVIDDIFAAFREKILHIRAIYPEAVKIDYFLDLYSDDMYVGLFRRLYGDELDEMKFEPLSYYQLQYYRYISGEELSPEKLSEALNIMEKLQKTELCGNPYYSFAELMPYKLVRLGDMRGLTLPFDAEYLGVSSSYEEISLRLSNTSSDLTEEYFKDEIKALSAAFSQAERALK